MLYVVDFQGFKDNNNEFIIKEFAICSVNGQFQEHWLIKSPYALEQLNIKQHRQYLWLVHNLHGINWEDGYITLHELFIILSKFRGLFLIKGLEKKLYLQKFGFNVENLDSFDCPSLNILLISKTCCFGHRYLRRCALNNVINLAIWISQNLAQKFNII